MASLSLSCDRKVKTAARYENFTLGLAASFPEIEEWLFGY